MYKTNICTFNILNNKVIGLLLHVSAKLRHLKGAYKRIGSLKTH